MVNSGGRNYKEIDDIISNHCIHYSTAKQGKCQKAKVDEGSFFEDFLCFFCFGFGLSLLFVSLVMPSSVKGYAEGGTEGWFILRTLIFGSKSGEFHDYTNCTFPELITGNFPGSIGAACATCVLLGGFFLVMRGAIRMYAPIAYIVTLTVFFPLSNLLSKETGFGYDGYIAFMLSSGAVFVAVFMLGDLTTMPSRFTAGFFAGMVCAVLTLVMRAFVRPDVALLAPVLSVNFMSFVLDFLMKTISRRNLRSREVDLR